jgi:hypothetical protein
MVKKKSDREGKKKWRIINCGKVETCRMFKLRQLARKIQVSNVCASTTERDWVRVKDKFFIKWFNVANYQTIVFHS